MFAHIGVGPLDPLPVVGRIHATRPEPITEELRTTLADRFADDTRRLIEVLGFEPARRWPSAPADLRVPAAENQTDDSRSNQL